MRAFWAMTVANVRSFIRDRASVFWSLAFPLILVLLFGFIFGSGDVRATIGWVDQDHTTASAELRDAFASVSTVELVDGAKDGTLAQMRTGKVAAVIVVPAGYGEALARARAGTSRPAAVTVYVDPSQAQATAQVTQLVNGILASVDLAGRPPAIVAQAVPIQTEELNAVSYYVPSMLGLAIMQVGIFAAVPLVGDREKLILKRLNATPLRRWQLVGSNVATRVLIAIAQAIVIVGVGTVVFGVQTTGQWLATAGFVVLGALTFLALGYVLASFAPTEDAANGMVTVVQFPLMFLSGIFFQIGQLPSFLQAIARVMPLTYLADGLRQVMVGGAPFAPLWVCVAVLAGWLVACFAIAARFFRWQ